MCAGLYSTFPYLEKSKKRVATCTLKDLTAAIREEGAKFAELSQPLQDQLAGIAPGCMVLNYEAGVRQLAHHFGPFLPPFPAYHPTRAPRAVIYLVPMRVVC